LQPSPQIDTDRLVLTRLRTSDAEALFAYRSLPEVARYQGWAPVVVEDATDFIRSMERVEFDSPGTWFQFGIRARKSGDLVGDLGVHFLDDGEQVEIGFTMSPEWQGRGLATEAVTGLLDHLFRTLHKHRVCASVDPRNAPSLRLLRRIGMRLEGHFAQSVPVGGEWTDDLAAAVLASEWNEREVRA
jgi:RimJ/RimL family protein N-acetyltransferase